MGEPLFESQVSVVSLILSFEFPLKKLSLILDVRVEFTIK